MITALAVWAAAAAILATVAAVIAMSCLARVQQQTRALERDRRIAELETSLGIAQVPDVLADVRGRAPYIIGLVAGLLLGQRRR